MVLLDCHRLLALDCCRRLLQREFQVIEREWWALAAFGVKPESIDKHLVVAVEDHHAPPIR